MVTTGRRNRIYNEKLASRIQIICTIFVFFVFFLGRVLLLQESHAKQESLIFLFWQGNHSSLVYSIPNADFHGFYLQRDVTRVEATHGEVSEHVPEPGDAQRVVGIQPFELAFGVDAPYGLDLRDQGGVGWVVG